VTSPTVKRRALLDAEATATAREYLWPAWIATVMLRERRVVLLLTGLGVALGLAIALLRKPTYTTTFSFLPQSSQDPSRAGLASLAGQFGIALGSMGGGNESPQLYADLLLTREVLAPIAQDTFVVDAAGRAREPLAAFFDVPDGPPSLVLDNTLRVLRRDVISSTVAARKTGMVSVGVSTRSPQVSYQVAQRLVAGLNTFNLTTRQTQARQERLFTETRYAAERTALRQAEDALQQFLQANRQYVNSPQLTFEKERLQREVGLHQQIVTTLAQQYEDARIREVRDTPVITVIERPTVAARPDPQMRAVILLLCTALGFGVGAALAFLRDVRARSPEWDAALEPLRAEWRRLRGRAVG
jgi:uncharacterized protein involved in exopolysaccharide biosynthesis